MKFRYTARDSQGKLNRGTVEAGDLRSAAASLTERHLVAIGITPVSAGLDLWTLKAKLGRVTLTDTANFTRQLATMITAGLPLSDSLGLLRLQSKPAFAQVVGAILTDVQGGMSLSGALARHPKVFSPVYVALIRAGEAAGVIETILARLADTLEKSREFNSRVRTAMVYPLIVIVGMLGVMVLMMVVVVPKLTALYAEFGENLPATTRLVVGLSNFLVHFWWLGLVVVGLVVVGVRKYLDRPSGRRWWHRLRYRLPVVGGLARQVMLTELTQTLALLVGSGVAVVEALNIVAQALGNVIVEAEVVQIGKRVEKGFPLSVGFAESDLFPPIVGQMMAVGEETGKLDDVLDKLSSYFASESELRVKGLTTAIEPLIIVLLGAGVGFLIFTIVMPIYNLSSQF